MLVIMLNGNVLRSSRGPRDKWQQKTVFVVLQVPYHILASLTAQHENGHGVF